MSNTNNSVLRETYRDAIRQAALVRLAHFNANVYFHKPTKTFVVTAGGVINDSNFTKCYFDNDEIRLERPDVVKAFEMYDGVIVNEESKRRYKATCHFYTEFKHISIQTSGDDYKNAEKYDPNEVAVYTRYDIIRQVLGAESFGALSVIAENIKANAIADRYLAEVFEQIHFEGVDATDGT